MFNKYQIGEVIPIDDPVLRKTLIDKLREVEELELLANIAAQRYKEKHAELFDTIRREFKTPFGSQFNFRDSGILTFLGLH